MLFNVLDKIGYLLDTIGWNAHIYLYVYIYIYICLTLFNGPYLVSCIVSVDLNGVGVRGEHSMIERLKLGVRNLKQDAHIWII